MTTNTIPQALSERLLREDGNDVVPFLNKEAIPILRQIRTVLNDPDRVIEYTGVGGETVTLPSAAASEGFLGRVVIVVNNGTGAVTVAAATGDTVNDAASVSLTFNAAAVFVSDGGTEWRGLGGEFKATSLDLSGTLTVAGRGTFNGDRLGIGATTFILVTGASSGSYLGNIVIGNRRCIQFGQGFSNIPLVGVNTDVGQGLQICSDANQRWAFSGAVPTDQLAAIADASGGGTVDTEARAALNTLLAGMREKGIIAT